MRLADQHPLIPHQQVALVDRRSGQGDELPLLGHPRALLDDEYQLLDEERVLVDDKQPFINDPRE